MLGTSSLITARPAGKLWGIAAINIVGSGVLAALACAAPVKPQSRLLLGTGLCGGFTTFSTFAVDVVGLVESRQYLLAAKFVTVNNIGSIAAAAGVALVFRRLGGHRALPPPLLHSRSHELLSLVKVKHPQK